MTSEELQWLNDYHTQVREKLMPLIDKDSVKAWLTAATAPISG